MHVYTIDFFIYTFSILLYPLLIKEFVNYNDQLFVRLTAYKCLVNKHGQL